MRFRTILIYFLGFAAIFSLFFVDIARESLLVKYSKNAEPNRIRNTVRFYNRALEKAIIENKIDYLDEYTTFEIKQKVGLQIYYELREQGIEMEARLIRLNFTKEDIKGKKATVWTNEIWENVYYDVKNKAKIVIPKEKIEYEMKYTLEKEKNNWRVSKIDIVKEKKSAI